MSKTMIKPCSNYFGSAKRIMFLTNCYYQANKLLPE